MAKEITHGSLFSGSGGFDEAARMNGIRSLWQSEIEPFAVRVLKKNFPEARRYGDISKLDGRELEPVDIISGGSPCQDMSIAGNRAGLDGERSTLFHEQIRIVKEMREATDGKRPRYMVWENVPGAFSSNGGEDFRSVLEETASIAEPGVSVPRPEKKWSYAGAIVGEGYSIAWRTMDAQYWGVPQRRRRIYLVADFGGESAGEILFERESLSWNPTESRIKGEGAAGSAEGRAGITVPLEFNPTDSRIGINEGNAIQTFTARMGTGRNQVPLVMEKRLVVDDQGGANISVSENGVSPTLRAEMHGHPPLVLDRLVLPQKPLAFGISPKESNAMKSDNPKSGFYEASTSRTLDTKGGNPTCNQGGIVVVERMTFANQAFGQYTESDTASALKQRDYKYPTDLIVAFEPGAASRVGSHVYMDGKSGTLRARAGDNRQAVAYAIQGNMIGRKEGNGPQGGGIAEEVSYTLTALDRHAVAYRFIVRRLTPLECCRLQGFEDGWTDGLVLQEVPTGELEYWEAVWREHWEAAGKTKAPKAGNAVIKWLMAEPSDSDKYKLWGNGIALPCAYHVFEGIKEVICGKAASHTETKTTHNKERSDRMKVKDFAEALKLCKGRLPVVAVGENGVERYVGWQFHNDGRDWASFKFLLSDYQYPDLDTDAAKLILDYCLNDPDERPSLFSGIPLFWDYDIGLTWCTSEPEPGSRGGAYAVVGIKEAKVEPHRSAFPRLDGEHPEEMHLVIYTDPLPKLGECDVDEPEEEAEECEAKEGDDV